MRLRRDPDRNTATGSPALNRNPFPKAQVKICPSDALKPDACHLPEASRPWYRSDWSLILGLAAVTFLAYWPCLNGDFVWDDDAWTLKLRGLHQNLPGLVQIWTNLTALQQYYPLTATTFWIDYHVWGFWPLPYHVENILLHILAAVLFWRLLRRLQVPGASVAMGIFALHPLMVESAGWITERKNVLSLVLYLGALHCYGQFTYFWSEANTSNPDGANKTKWRWYYGAFIFFLGAYLAKATAFSLPAVLLLVCWWKRGRLRAREDLLPTLPFWAMAVGLGLLTSWLERTHVGARGPDWDISFLERCLIAGRALWFYVGKLVCPLNLCFIYPKWQLDTGSIRQWLWPGTALLALLLLWTARRRIGRGPLVAILFFAGTLFPLLGFFNGYFMRYSFVCDHWCYLSSLGLVALGGAVLTLSAEWLNNQSLLRVFKVIVLMWLAVLTWRHTGMFTDSETLYRTTLAVNPNADLAHNNLGLLLAQAGELDEAISHLQKAVDLRPTSAHAHNNLANAFRVTGQPRQAVEQYELSLRLDSNNANTLNNLALLLATSSDASIRNGQKAIELAQQAKELTQGRNPVVLATLAAAFAEAGQFTNAVSALQMAIQLTPPSSPATQTLYGQLELYQRGQPLREPPPTRER